MSSSKVLSSSRRKFMRTSVATGVVVGGLPLLSSCGGSDTPAPTPPPKAPRVKELRTHYFDLSNADPAHTYHLVVGSRHHSLTPASSTHRQAARASNASLQGVSDAQITHVAENIPLPADDIQLVWVKGVAPGKSPADAGWSLHHMFIHIPSTTSVPAATPLAQTCGKSATSHRLAFSTCTGPASALLLPASDANPCDVQNSNYKTSFDSAVTAICNHPELLSFDAATLTLVHEVICSDRRTLDLSVSIFKQKTAWYTPTSEIDVLTGKPAVDRNNKPVVSGTYSAETKDKLGKALASILPKIKDDPRFGANITNADATQATPELKGKLWSVKNSQPARSGGAALPLAARMLLRTTSGTPSWTPANVCDGYGFRIDKISGNQQTLSFTVHNWFVRHLGLYVRFVDSAGKGIDWLDGYTGDLNTDLTTPIFSTGSYQYLGLISPEYTVFGIPVAEASQSFTVTIPRSASSVEIVAGGLGSGNFPDTGSLIAVGTAFTGLFEFLIPSILLAYGAYGGMAAIKKSSLSDSELNKQILLSLAKLSLTALSVPSAGPVALLGAAQSVGKALIKAETKRLAPLLAEAIAEGEFEAAVEDFIPFGIGLILEAVEALGVTAGIVESSAEVARSPWTYQVAVVGTHSLSVTINPDPANVAGFPATATRYRIYAYFDGKSGGDSGELTMPAGTRTSPLTYVFNNVPYGGQVVVKASFYSDSGWLAGLAQSETPQQKDNTQDSLTITLKEFLVPLRPDTTYGHRQKLALNSAGQRTWVASATAPTTSDGNLSCGNTAGELCELVGITLSEHFGAIGYSWRAYSAGVSNQAGALGQWYQFGNISFTQTPQSGYVKPQLGFNSPARLAYDLSSTTSNNFYIDPSEGKNRVRRIVTSAVDTPPAVDGPASNLAVGKFNFSSDAFLVHPTGVLVSLNSGQHCIEVLRPSATPVPDAQAPLAYTRSSKGTREGLVSGPVCAAIAPNGAILVLESGNLRIQAFDTRCQPGTHVWRENFVLPDFAQRIVRRYLSGCGDGIGRLCLCAVQVGDPAVHARYLFVRR